jgi:RNA polymerase sigma-70 factor (ECF subfamily)
MRRRADDGHFRRISALLTARSLRRITGRPLTRMMTPHMTETSNREDIVKSKAGDMDAFARVVRMSHGYAFRLAFHLLCDEEESKDVVQESFIRVWKNLDRYDVHQKFTTWLYAIVSNLCLDRLRSQRRWRARFVRENPDNRSPDSPDGPLLDDQYSNEELASIIRGLTHLLPPKQKLVFALRDLEDLTLEEVAEITTMAVGTVKVNLHYARRTIREYLKTHYHVEGA